MSIKKIDVLDAVIYGSGLLLFIFLMASVIWSLLEERQSINNVVKNTAEQPIATETEVYRVVCIEEKDGYCGAYSVRRIVRE